MKLPIAWLRDYLDLTLSSDEIAAKFAQLGFPVDEIVRRPPLSGVTIGRLARIEKHPNADRLQVCTVDIAGSRTLTIATAATNVAEGNVVPVATIGAELVGLTIAPRKMRGIDSEGMLCSAAEVGLESAWFEDGILQLDDTLTVGADFVETFRLNDDVLDVEITANRVDAMSVVGLARELAASLGVALREPRAEIVHYHAVDTPDARIAIESGDCTRFVGQRFSNVVARTSPFWMRVRLALAGQRPIDNLVDISNFVMLETAQPLHFYDFDRLAGGELIARDARPGETIRTLDGANRPLDPRFLVIADDREPQSVAGLMGGAGSEVTAATRELLVEAATFSGPRVRRMSVALGLRTEASARHEKGLPPGLAPWGAARAAHLLQLEGATVHAPFEATPAVKLAPPKPVRISLDRFPALLGIEIAEAEAVAALSHLGFEAHATADDSQIGEAPRRCLDVTPPPWRGDVTIAEDVVEEVARVVGYDRIVAHMPPILDQEVSSAEYRAESRVAHALAELGFREAVTLALQPRAIGETYVDAGVAVPGGAVEILNPISEEQRFLRFSLVPALLALAQRYGADDSFRAFEVGHTFATGVEAATVETPEAVWLAAMPATDEPSWRDGGFLGFKGEAVALVRSLTGRTPEAVAAAHAGWHPGKTAALRIDGKDVAIAGAVDPRLVAAFGVAGGVYAGRLLFAELPAYRAPGYAAPSKYPPVARDLALVVEPDVPASDIERAVRAGADGALADVRVFDEYRGPQIADGKKSIAVRVVLQSYDATLTDADADAHIAAILRALEERVGAKIRA